jgi:hypothetical protein
LKLPLSLDQKASHLTASSMIGFASSLLELWCGSGRAA